MMNHEARRGGGRRLVIFVAVISCGFLTGYCIAKMSGVVDGLEGVRQVAAWDVEAALGIDGDQNEITVGEVVAGNGEMTYPIAVTNNSTDVASDCIITLTGVPNGVTASLTGDGVVSPMVGSVVGGKIVFSNPENSNVLTLGFGESKDFVINFSAPLEADAVSNAEISVGVEFIQKDPRL